jgi:hypothetical protein
MGENTRGWLAYNALVLLILAGLVTAHFLDLFRTYFDGFGDKDPDDAFDGTD